MSVTLRDSAWIWSLSKFPRLNSMEAIAALERLEVPDGAAAAVAPLPFILTATGELGDVAVTPRYV